MLEPQENVERKLRQKMRVYPGTHPGIMPTTAVRHPETAQPQRENETAEKRRYEDARRKAIVSIYGNDLSSEDQIAEAHARDAESAKNRHRKKRAA